MPTLVLPNGEHRLVSMEATAADALRDAIPADGGEYELLFLGRTIPHCAKLADVKYLKDSHNIHLVRRNNGYETALKMSEEEVIRMKALCHATLGQIAEADYRKLEDYFSSSKGFKEMIEENPILKHDSEGFSVVCDLKLLLELLFKNDTFAFEHPHCLGVLKKVMDSLISSAPTLLFPGPSQPRHAPTAMDQPNNMITTSMLQQALASAMEAAPTNQQANFAPAAISTNSKQYTEQMRQQYAAQLEQMQEFGFSDSNENLQALIMSNGNVEAALELVISMRDEMS